MQPIWAGVSGGPLSKLKLCSPAGENIRDRCKSDFYWKKKSPCFFHMRKDGAEEIILNMV